MTDATIQKHLRDLHPHPDYSEPVQRNLAYPVNLWLITQAADALDAAQAEADTLRAEVERLRAAIEPFADVSDFLASETEGLSDDDVFNLKLAGSKLLLMTYTAKQFHEARAALAHGEAD
jgi:hypothetical protein